MAAKFINIGKASTIVEKFYYQSERKKSRAAQVVKNYNELRRRDEVNFYNIREKFNYKKVSTSNKKARNSSHVVAESDTLKVKHAKHMSDNNIYEWLNYLDHECITHNPKKIEIDSHEVVQKKSNTVESEFISDPIINDSLLCYQNNQATIWSIFFILDTLLKIQYMAHINDVTMDADLVGAQEIKQANNVATSDANVRVPTKRKASTGIGQNVSEIETSEKENSPSKTKKVCPINENAVTKTNKNNRMPRPRYKIRKSIEESQFQINTILFKLNKDEADKWLKIADDDDKDLTNEVKKAININIKEARLQGQRLYISPLSQEDHDAIVLQKGIEVFETKTLYNKSTHFIIKEISYNDIVKSKSIQDDLKAMGVVKWAPLFDDGSVESKMDAKVRCQCESRAALSDIMIKYFEGGRKFKTYNNLIALASFHPDIKNPVQCFKCHSYDGHMAYKCDKLICGRCGEPNHCVDECLSSVAKCTNCGERHEARDLRCVVYQDKRVLNEEQACYGITGESLKKFRMFKNRKISYAQRAAQGPPMAESRVHEHERRPSPEPSSVKQTSNQNNVEKRINELAREVSNQHDKQKEWFDNNSGKTEKSVKTLEEAAGRLMTMCDNVDNKISVMVKVECDKLRDEMAAESSKIYLRIDEVDKSQSTQMYLLASKVGQLETQLEIISGQSLKSQLIAQ